METKTINVLNGSIEWLKQGDELSAIIMLNLLKKELKGKYDRIIEVLNHITDLIEDHKVEEAYKHLIALSDSITLAEIKKETD